jgi:hypothetical protein
MPWIQRTVIVILANAIALLPPVAKAGSWALAKPSAALNLTFNRVLGGLNGHCGPSVLASGHFTLIAYANHPAFPERCASKFRLFDDHAGKHRDIDTESCRYQAFRAELEAFGAPWVLFFCGDGDKLYNIDTREWVRLRCTTRCIGNNQLVGESVGARWVEFRLVGYGDCGDHIHFECGPASVRFFNITTHQIRRNGPKSGGTILDLDSPTLARSVCKPLRAPADGTLTVLGTFAVETGASGSFLEQCGSSRKMPIGVGAESLAGHGILANLHAVAWVLPATGGSEQLSGLLLPSLRTFTLVLPANITGLGAATLDSSRLYVADADGNVWAAAFPPT